MGYEHLVHTPKAIAITAPAARAFELTVEFALGEGKDTATVGRLEDHVRDRHRADPARAEQLVRGAGRPRSLTSPGHAPGDGQTAEIDAEEAA